MTTSAAGEFIPVVDVKRTHLEEAGHGEYWEGKKGLNGVLDTGFNGSALVSVWWLQQYEKVIGIKLSRRNAKEMHFTFGAGETRVSKQVVYLPVWIDTKFKGLWTRVIPGYTELLLGDEAIQRFDIIIRSKTSEVKYGPGGKWQTLNRNKRNHLVLSLAPEGKEQRLLAFLKSTKKLVPSELKKGVRECELRQTKSFMAAKIENLKKGLLEKLDKKKKKRKQKRAK
jgi:hypothetical protein